MHVTVCVCTRDRGATIAATLESLKASHTDDFDVVVVDQSASPATADVVLKATGGDSRFTYIRSASVGASTARNIAIAHATGPLVAFTDDDCEAPPEWLERIVTHFRDKPGIGLLCGIVRAAPHDSTRGFVPSYDIHGQRLITSPWSKWRGRGISANMTFQRDVLHRIGPFDEALGPGAPLRLAEDFDMMYRVLRAGFSVLDASDVYVIHHGFRRWKEARLLMRHAGLGIGAAYMKHLRLGDIAVLPTFLYEWGNGINWSRLVRLQKYSGLAYVLFYGWGAINSFRYDVDSRQRVYVPRKGQ